MVLLCAARVAAGDSWPEYRGPTCDGHAEVASLPLTWSESHNIKWKTFIHDKGWSTPVVQGDQIWLTTATEDGRELFVVCVDRRDGRILFDRKLFDVPHPDPLGNELNSYASPSPTIASGRVYVHFGSYGTASIDPQNCTTIWQRRDLPCKHFRGPASSPIVFENLLIFHMDGSDVHYIVALDQETGQTVWKTERSTDYGDIGQDGRPAGDGDFRKAFNTPLLVRVDGQLQLISPSAKAIYAYDPRTGREIWQVKHQGHSTAPRALFDGRHAYVVTGSGQTELLAINPRGKGDITATHVIWRSIRQVPRRSSPVLVDGLIYGCTDNGVASCIEAESSQQLWQRRVGGEFSASLLYACGRIYGFDQDGEAVVLAPGRTYQELARNRLDNGCMASPVAVGNALYVRTKTHLYCVQEL
jgi:outer membrane protein assembly factor BamB